MAYLDICSIPIFDHVEASIGKVHLKDGAVHQELVHPRVEIGGGVKVLVQYDIRARSPLALMYEAPQPAPSRDLQQSCYKRASAISRPQQSGDEAGVFPLLSGTTTLR